MAGPVDRARKLAATWGAKPTEASANAMRALYAGNARKLPLPVRAQLCLALGEAAELQGQFNHARYLYASALTAIDPTQDERLYTRAALRALLNASRLGEGEALGDVAGAVEALPELTPRLACLGAFARGLERLLREEWTEARRSFEAAMGATWESHDSDGEALSHHMLGQTWSRLGKIARAREHAEAAHRAAVKSGSKLLQHRLALEDIMYRLRAGMTAAALGEAHTLLTAIRRLGFPRFESLAWTKVARGVLVDRVLLSRSESILPESLPDPNFILALRAALDREAANGAERDPAVTKAMRALATLAPK